MQLNKSKRPPPWAIQDPGEVRVCLDKGLLDIFVICTEATRARLGTTKVLCAEAVGKSG